LSTSKTAEGQLMLQMTFKAHRHNLDDTNAPGSTTNEAEFGQGVEIQFFF